MRVSELEGVELDYWVAKAMGLTPYKQSTEEGVYVHEKRGFYMYSRAWNDGGPLVERFSIAILPYPVGAGYNGVWHAVVSADGVSEDSVLMHGDTPLVAACRAIVASVYGEEVPDA